MNFIKKCVRFLLGTIFSILGAAGWLLQTLLQVVTLLFILCIVAGFVVLIKVKPQLDRSREVAYDILAQMERDDFRMLSDTEIFDKDGRRIGLINAGHYEYADISRISLNLQNAYIAQEDRRFKSHNGVDWIATTRAGLALVKHKGAITQGGSTITQQIIKNTYLTQEQTFTRKIVEILLAPEIEKTYSKADIMEFYCNTNFYGHQCYGVQAASRYYFGKNASDLEVYEAAVLVGISNSPSAYDPVTHPEAALKKRNEVLKSMLEVDMLSQEEYEKATKHSLSIIQEQQEGTDDSYLTSYAIHCASLELMKLEEFPFRYTFADKSDYEAYMESYTAVYNQKNDAIRNGGYKIYTSLDQELQNMLQTNLDEVLSSYTELQENGKYALQGAAVIIDNRTNYVTAIVGGRGSEDAFNRAYLSARQPGSTIKPLIDYGPAFDTGEYYPSRIINDHQWEGGPSNSGGHYYGPVTVREALNRSLNTVAWQVLEDIGTATGLSYLDSMQFQRLTYVDNDVPALSIGGFTNGVRVVDMAKGFSTLANNGVYNDRTCILRIEHEQEGDLTARSFALTKQVYTIDTAFMLTDILKGTLTSPYGTGRSLRLAGDIPAAGKTGTTNSSRDTWFCGYTRYYTTAVWVGYDIPRAMPGIFGSTYAGVIWKNVMNQLHEGLEPWDWEQPETVVKDFYDPITGARLQPSDQPVSPEEAAAAAAGQAAENSQAATGTQEQASQFMNPAPAETTAEAVSDPASVSQTPSQEAGASQTGAPSQMLPQENPAAGPASSQSQTIPPEAAASTPPGPSASGAAASATTPAETSASTTAPAETTTAPHGPAFNQNPGSSSTQENSSGSLYTPEIPPWAAVDSSIKIGSAMDLPDTTEAIFFMTSNAGPGVQGPASGSSWSGPGAASGPGATSGSGPSTSGPSGSGASGQSASGSSASGPSGSGPAGPGSSVVTPVGPGVTAPPSSSSETQSTFAEAMEAISAEAASAAQQEEATVPETRPAANLMDYFSTSSEQMARLNLTNKAQDKLLEELEGLIHSFEYATIHSAADVPRIRERYKEISSKLKQVQSGESRKELYDRTEARWQEFSEIIDTMSEAIRVYEEQQALLEKQELRKAEEQAALDRKQQEIQDRISAFEISLQLLEGLQYQSSDADALVMTAIAKLGDLYGYTETEVYRSRLEAAIRRVRSLPAEAQWNAQEAQRKANAISQGAAQQEALYQMFQTERRFWNSQTYEAGRN